MHQYSFWEEDVFLAPSDIVIAGAGFAGLWSAYFLKKLAPGLKITIVERNVFPSGASTRNAGFACFGSLTELLDDAAFFGNEKMMEIVLMRYQGLQILGEVFNPDQIDYTQSGGYELISDGQFETEKSLGEDIAAINTLLEVSIGQKNVFGMADAKIHQFGFAHTEHLVENRLEGQLHSGKLARCLLDTVRAQGVQIITGTDITGHQSQNGDLRISTSAGANLRTKQLLICTNAFAGQLSDRLDITPARGQVLLTAPIPDLTLSGTFHFDEGYYYFRNVDGRVLLGGARNLAFGEEETTDMLVTDTIQNELERFLREVVIPGKEFVIDRRWSGIMGMAQTKFPTVTKIEPDVYCAIGMGGIGIAVAPVVGQKVASLMIDSARH